MDRLKLLQEQVPAIVEVAHVISGRLADGGTALFCGNGGSAADAQHLSAELMGRYMKERNPLPALALTVDTSILTAIGNDYGYEYVFERQVRGIGRRGDVLVGISTSGESRNVILALKAAREKGIVTIGLCGSKQGSMSEYCDYLVAVPADRTDQIQELHIMVGHIICGLIEEVL